MFREIQLRIGPTLTPSPLSLGLTGPESATICRVVSYAKKKVWCGNNPIPQRRVGPHGPNSLSFKPRRQFEQSGGALTIDVSQSPTKGNGTGPLLRRRYWACKTGIVASTCCGLLVLRTTNCPGAVANLHIRDGDARRPQQRRQKNGLTEAQNSWNTNTSLYHSILNRWRTEHSSVPGSLSCVL